MGKRRLGSSAIVVSDICMGTMTFGNQADEKTAHRVLDMSMDAGINFFDTAEAYPVPPDAKYCGLTEEIVGRWMKGKNRDAIILATKVSGPSHSWISSPQRAGMTALDRHNITRAIEASLKRLQTDYIDLYQTHWPDNKGGSYDETMEVLDELVRAGKVRVTGCSNENSWGLMKSQSVAEKLGTVRFETIQNNFSLNHRRFEDDLATVCRKEGISLLPYSPMGGGVLSGKYLDGKRPEGARFTAYMNEGKRQQAMVDRFANERALASTARFIEIAKQADMSAVTMAIAWSKQHDFVASTITGVTSTDQCAEIFAAMDLVLSDEVMKAINQVSKDIPYPMG